MKIFTVSELTAEIKALLEPSLQFIEVQGEISNFKLQSSGHLYFSLKDAASQVSAVLFRGNAASLSRMPKEGDQVVASGEIRLYAPRGQYQLVIRELRFVGVGELLLKFQKLKETLEARGWFDPKRKKKLPKLPKRIGVVTSPTGAVIQDILNVLTRRFSGVQVILNPVKVQGEGAAYEISEAIRDFNKFDLADVLIVGRGGGSIEDLWAFNEEETAKAIFESKIPIISAVGHETDVTIADWVADVRAPTPSAAAEIAILEKEGLLKATFQMQGALQARLIQKLEEKKKHLHMLQKHPLLSSPYNLLLEPIQKLDRIQSDFEMSLQNKFTEIKLKLSHFKMRLERELPSTKMREMKEKVSLYRKRLDLAILALLKPKREKLEALYRHLKSIHPNHLLKKGFSLLFFEGRLVRTIHSLQTNQTIKARLFDGDVHLKVDSVEAYGSGNPSLF